MPTKIIYTPNYTTIGNPTITDDYIASSFNSRNGVAAPVTLDTSKPWRIFAKINSGSNTSTRQKFIGCANSADQKIPTLEFRNGRVYACMPNSAGSGWLFEVDTGFVPSTNTDYWFKYSWDGSTYSVEVSTDGESYTSVYTNSSQTAAYHSDSYKVIFGNDLYGGSYQLPFLGTVDLKECYFVVDGAEAWRAVTVTEVETSGSIAVSKGYYDNGSNKIQMTSAMTKNLTELSSGETIGCKNKLFAYSKDDVADILITADSNVDISTAHDVSVELDKNVYLSCLKNYIVGHTPLQKIPMQIGGELTADYTASDNSVIDSDYILTSTTSGKYVYKAFSESNVTTAEVTVKCKQTATKYISDVFSGWGIVGFVDGNLGVWNGSNWRTGTYYPAGTWVWVKAISTPASGTIQIYGLLDNGYTLDTLPATSQWDLCYNGSISYGSPLTSSLYIPDSGSSEWFNGQVDLKEVQVKKNGTEIWRAVSTSTNAIKNSSNGFVYDSTNDTTFWYPKETILELRNFTDLQDRCNLYLANEDGKDVSRLLAGSSLPGPIKTNYVVEGSPTINSSYEASNFTSSNYISLPETIPSADGTSIITAIKVSGSPSSTQGIIGNSLGVPNFYIESNKKFGCYNGSTSREGSTAIADNTKYWVQIRYTSSNTRFLLLQDNGYTLDTLPDVSNWNVEMEFSGDVYGGKELVLGALSSGSLPFTVGTCYLADTAIATNGVYVWKAVEQNPVIASSKQQGYVYLNHAHNEVIGIGEEPDEIVLEVSSDNNEVVASQDHYWTYLKDSTYNCKGRSVGISSMTGSALSGYLLATPIGALIYTGSNNQGLLGDAFTGYTVTFTNTSHSAIASLTKTGTRCRCYSAYNGNVENPHYYSFYVTSLPVTGEIPMSMTSFIGEREITPSSSTSSYTYDAATDTITYSGYTASYAGDVYVNLGA